MEALFVNRYYPTKKLFEGFYKKTSQKYSKIIGFIGIALLAVTVLTLAWMNALDLFLLLFALVGFSLCLALILFHKIMAYGAMRRTLKEHDGKIYQTIVTFTDKITLREGSVSLSLNYKDIVKTVDCGGLLALMFSKSSGVIIKKDGFAQGDFKSFSAFLEKKLSENS